MRIWAVDISGYSLWTSESRGDAVIRNCLGDALEEHSRVKKYLREIDQIRCLAGKALIRLVILSECRHLSLNDVQVKITREGKPYLSSPILDFDFNITHDGDWVALAFEGTLQNEDQIPTSRIGVDIMEIYLPHYEKNVQDFVETMDMTLTTRERDWILTDNANEIFETSNVLPANLDRQDYNQLKKLYTLWTYKEAYTKAKGIGLGYDFQKIEIDMEDDRLDLIADGRKEEHIRTVQVILPCGQNRSGKIGAGTGMCSLLVAMQLGIDSRSVLLTSLTSVQAQEQGHLRLWSMDELIKALSDVISTKL